MLMDCPFCGSKAVIRTKKKTYEELVKENGTACVVIGCSNFIDCGTEMYTFSDEPTEYDTMLQKSIDKWNRRSYG